MKKMSKNTGNLAHLFDALGDALITTDVDGHIVSMNPAAERLTGYRAKEVSGESIETVFNIVNIRTGKRSHNQVKKALKNGKLIWRCDEVKLISRDGAEFPITGGAAPIQDNRGNGNGVALVFREAGKRKQSEQALAESEELFRLTLSSISDAVFVSDAAGAFTFICPNVHILFGYSQSEVAGMKNIRRLLGKNIFDADELKRRGEIPNIERTIVDKAGCEHAILLTVKQISIKGGTVLYTCHDVTDRKRAEDQLRESERIYRDMINGMNDTIWVIDFDTTILDVNNAATTVLGYSRQELLSMKITDIDVNLTPDQVQGLASSMPRDKIQVFETSHGTKDGKKIPVEVSSSLVSYTGRTVILSIARDITERKQAEEKLRESESRYHQILDSMLEGCQIIGPDWRYLYLNQSAAIHGRRPAKELIGRTMMEAYPGIETTSLFQILTECMERRLAKRFENLFAYPDGSLGWFELSVQPAEEGLFILSWDITERKQAEQQRARLAERLNLATRASQIGIWDWDIQKNILVWDEQMYALYGLQPGEFGGAYEAWLNGVHPDDRESSNLVSARAVRGEGDYDTEFRVVWPDGTVHWLKAAGQVFRDEQGTPVRMVGVNYDITPRKRAEEELQESEFRYRELFDNINSGVAVYEVMDQGRDFIFKEFNRAGEMIDHDRRERLIGKSVFEMRPGIEEFGLLEVFRRVWRTGQPAHHPISQYKDNRLTGWYDNYVYRISGKEIVAVFEDVTERKRAEQALKLSEEKFRAIFDKANDGIFLADIETRKFFMCNATCARMLGYSQQEFLNLGIADIHPAEDLPAIFEQFELFSKGEEGIRGDIRFRQKNDHVFYADLNPTLITIAGKEYLLIVFRDTTERRKAEEELRNAKEKAEESDRLKTAFLANMSHEIRTPMNGILGFTSLLRASDLSEADRVEYIDIINLSGERMLNTINDLIEISSIETGVVPIVEVETAVNEIMRFLYNFFDLQARHKGLVLSCSTPLPDERARVITDKNKLDSILINLIRNAIKFTRMGSIEFGYEPKQEMLEFYVTDTGMGIPADRLDAIFDRFVQGDINITRPYEGSGLGLAITKAYVEMLGGTIRVESKENVGSTFRFTIPWKTKEAAGPENTPALIPDRENFLIESTLLIAEDDDISFIYLKHILNPLCKSILRATTGMEAVSLCLLDKSIDIVLMDIKMPEMDGYQAVRQIREFNKDVIIIAQTAYALKGEREKAMEVGCNDYISKPVEMHELLEILKKSMR